MTKSKENQLKHLQVRQSDVEKILSRARKQQQISGKEIQKYSTMLRDIDREITKLKQKAKDPIVSEHAMLRYFERCLGFDLELVKKDILAGSMCQIIRELPNGKFPQESTAGQNFRVVAKEGVVVTIET
jgi:hypothetical protein